MFRLCGGFVGLLLRHGAGPQQLPRTLGVAGELARCGAGDVVLLRHWCVLHRQTHSANFRKRGFHRYYLATTTTTSLADFMHILKSMALMLAAVLLTPSCFWVLGLLKELGDVLEVVAEGRTLALLPHVVRVEALLLVQSHHHHVAEKQGHGAGEGWLSPWLPTPFF